MLAKLSCILVLCASIAQCEERNLTFTLSAKNLPSKDDLSESDPYVKIYENKNGQLESVGKSETIMDTKDPAWVEVFWVKWVEGSSQKLQFEIIDKDLLDKDDNIDGAELNLDDYVANGENITLALKSKATLTIQKTAPIKFKLAVNNVPKKDTQPAIFSMFTSHDGLSDPYVKCYYKKSIGGEEKKFASTTTIDDTTDAAWENPIEFGNYQRGTDQYLLFKVKDYDSTSKDDDIGEVLFPADPFVEANVEKTFKITLDGEDTGATLTITPV